ncbi:MAG: radical SAM protein [Prevotella sp.]|nr:radical SAM protein [Prevotella sp.]
MTIIIKPTYACNFRCKYCYLTNDTKSSHKLFDAKFAKSVISQVKEVLANSPKQKLTLIWHGGEPLLWGIDNYRMIFSYMEKELAGLDYNNSLQTNLSLINEEYIELFLKYNVHVGFSLDGTKEINDSLRVDAIGHGTFSSIIEKVSLCQEKGLSIGCIVVGNKHHVGHIPELYQFLCDHKLNFKFNPLFSAGEACNNIDNIGITADEYAEMAIELFDLWYNDNEHRIKESNFEEITSNLLSARPSCCMFGKNCQDNFFAITPTGDVMPCGRFCDTTLKQYAYGNLHKETLAEILPRIKQSEAYKRSGYIERSSCKQCKYFNICYGGCLHDGFLKSGDFKSKTFLCSAYKRIFAHIDGRLEETVKQFS